MSSWTSDLQIFRFATLPPPPLPIPQQVKSWQIWKFQIRLGFWTSDFKDPLYSPPPPPANETWQIWNFRVKLDFLDFRCHGATLTCNVM